MIKAYLDSYNKITLEINKNYYGGKINSIYILTKCGPQLLNGLEENGRFNDYVQYVVNIEENIDLGEEYYLIDNYG